LLELLMSSVNQVVHRDWISERVWGPDADVTANVLDVFVASLRRKLEVGGYARLIHTVRGTGYIAQLQSSNGTRYGQ
jgi:DNA-binding response OmpR family regulator